MKDWWWYIVRGLFLLLIISLLYIYWPVNIYALNLYLSKTLPYISENFVGREQDMKEIKRLIDFKSNDIRIVNIIGPPGFGKSTLAIHAAHDVVRNGVIVHYINMAEVTDKTVIKEIAEKILGNSDTKIDNPVTFEPLLRWIQHRFWNTLLILDNCDDALNNQREELQDAIMKMVEESLGVKILMTSRRIATFINYYEWYRVEELSTEAACKLLENKVPKEIHLSHEMKKNITRSTGNVPLALHIVGSLLQLPASPSPKTVITQLEKEPILTLSSKELPSREQVYATIIVSYKHLSKEMQAAIHLLTVFPGSFDQQAALTVFNYSSSLHNYHFTNVGGDELIRSLVRCSLLEHHKRSDRYQFHRLIKQFLLFIQRNEWPYKAEQLAPAVRIHYAKQLSAIASSTFYERAREFLELEHHNVKYLLYGIKDMHPVTSNSRAHLSKGTEEFLEVAVALASAIDVGGINMSSHFSRATLCDSVKHCVTKMDKMMPYLDYYLLHQHFTQERVLHFYLLLISQLAICEEEIGIKAAVRVYTHRKHIIEAKRTAMGFKYIAYYTELSRYYHQLGQDEDVVECHRLMTQQIEAYLATCQPHQCNYYDIAMAYNAMNQFKEAIKFLDMHMSIKKEIYTVLLRLLFELRHFNSKLDDQERLVVKFNNSFIYNYFDRWIVQESFYDDDGVRILHTLKLTLIFTLSLFFLLLILSDVYACLTYDVHTDQ